jgi:RNA polymerase sigma-70 factor (ECF subfamily)
MTDKELVQLFQEGDNPNYAFNLIVHKYRERLYWHIRKIVISHDDADDVLQNTFIKAWAALADFRGDAQLYTWLYRIATNESLSFLKSKRTKFFLPLVNVEHQLINKVEDDTYFNGSAVQKKLQQMILKLPNKQRIIFNMRYFDEMKYEEISEVLGTSVGALKASYHHAVKKIEELMTE